MRILMLAPTPFFSDRGCHIRILNSYLRLKKNTDIIILTYPIGRNIKGIKIKRVIKLPGYKKISPGFSLYKPFLDFFILLMALKEMRKKNYNLIYAHLHEGVLIGIILRWFFGKKVIFDSQGSLVGELSSHGTIKKNSILYRLILPIERWITKNSDEIVTSTNSLKNFIINNLKIKKTVKVIEDFPDKSLFNRDIRPAKLKLPEGKKIVVYLGGMQKYKGIEYLIRAIPFANKKFHFLLMGYPNEEAKKLTRELNIENRVTFTGKIPYEKAPSYLKLGDVAVSPKTLESGEANAKVYNYIAMGLKVVCFDTPENRKLLGREGIYAKEKNIKNLARKINGAFIWEKK